MLDLRDHKKLGKELYCAKKGLEQVHSIMVKDKRDKRHCQKISQATDVVIHLLHLLEDSVPGDKLAVRYCRRHGVSIVVHSIDEGLRIIREHLLKARSIMANDNRHGEKTCIEKHFIMIDKVLSAIRSVG